MKLVVFGVLGSLFCFLLANEATAAEFSCQTPASGAYCQYIGPVRLVYNNADGLILMYYEAPVDIAQASSVGLPCGFGSAGAAAAMHDTIWDVEGFFNKSLLAALMLTKALKSDIWVQLRCANGTTPYLQIDRFWLK